MDCKTLDEKLTLYLYDELSSAEREAVEAHLAACERCRMALAEARRMRDLVSQRLQLEATPELLVRCRQGLDAALDREQMGWAGLLKKWRPFFSQPSLAAASLTLVALGFSLGWIIRPRVPRQTTPLRKTANAASVADLGRINEISQVAPDPQTGQVRITLNAARQVTMEGSLDDPRIQQVLLYAVKSYNNPGIRLDTLDALRSGSSNPSVQKALLGALQHDPNVGVRLAALSSVPKMPWSVEVQQALAAAAENDENLGVRDEAIDLLVERATLAKERAEMAEQQAELEVMLRKLAALDTDRYVRMKSAAALRKLGQEP